MEILFLASFKYEITPSNAENIRNHMKTVPTIGYFFSPHCGHCLAVSPYWANATKPYENDKSILILECNCYDNNDLCNTFYQTNSYPTFTKFIKGKAHQLKLNRTVEGITKEIEAIRKIDYKIDCSLYPFELNSYPAVVYKSNQLPQDGCKLIGQVLKESQNIGQEIIYFSQNPNATTPYVEIYDDANVSKIYNESVSVKEIADTLLAYGLTPFGRWRLELSKRSPKRLVILLQENSWIQNIFSSMTKKYQDSYLFNAIYYKDFNKRCPKLAVDTSDLPTFLISDKTKTKFYKTPKIDVNNFTEIKTLLTEVHEGKKEDLMVHQLEPVFKGKFTSDQKQFENARGMEPNAHNYFDIGLIILFVAISGILLYFFSCFSCLNVLLSDQKTK